MWLLVSEVFKDTSLFVLVYHVLLLATIDLLGYNGKSEGGDIL